MSVVKAANERANAKGAQKCQICIDVAGTIIELGLPVGIVEGRDVILYSQFQTNAAAGCFLDFHYTAQFPKVKYGKRLFDCAGFRLHECGKEQVFFASAKDPDGFPRKLAIFSEDYRYGSIFVDPGNGVDQYGYLSFPLGHFYSLYLTNILYRAGAVMFHGSGILTGSSALAFLGPSGSGKSTIARSWQHSRRALVLNDNDIIIKRGVDNKFRLYGAPPNINQRMSAAGNGELTAIIFIRHGQRNVCRKMSASEAMQSVVRNTFIPLFDTRATANILSLVQTICQEVPCLDMALSTQGIVEFIEQHTSLAT